MVEIRVAGRALLLVQVGRQVLTDEPVAEHPEDIALEIPAVDAAAEVVHDPPDRLVKLRTLSFHARQGHCDSLAAPLPTVLGSPGDQPFSPA